MRDTVIEECALALEAELYGAGFAKHIRGLKDKPRKMLWRGWEMGVIFAVGLFVGFFGLMIVDKWYL